jgi:lysozyme
MKFADISHHNGNINFAEFKKHVDGIIIRVGHGLTLDNKFADNLAACKAQNIPYAFYHYTEANTASEAQAEAKFVLSKIFGSKPLFVAYDAEYNELSVLSKNATTDIANAFLVLIKTAGYVPFIYTNENWRVNEIDIQYLKNKGYGFWYARYSDATPENTDRSNMCDIWQYSDVGTIPGNGSQYVDINVVYNLKQPATLKCDTNCDVYISPGKSYTALITAPTKPVMTCGTSGIVTTALTQSGTKWLFKMTATGAKGKSTGIFANGKKLFAINIK